MGGKFHNSVVHNCIGFPLVSSPWVYYMTTACDFSLLYDYEGIFSSDLAFPMTLQHQYLVSFTSLYPGPGTSLGTEPVVTHYLLSVSLLQMIIRRDII